MRRFPAREAGGQLACPGKSLPTKSSEKQCFLEYSPPGKHGDILGYLAVKEAPVSDPETRKNGKGEEREIHECIFDATETFDMIVELCQRIIDGLIGLYRHETCTREGEDRFLNTTDYCQATAAPNHEGNSPADILILHAGRNNVVRIVRDASGNCTAGE